MDTQNIDRYITDNVNIEEKYFQDLQNSNLGDLNIYIELHYIYFLLRKGENDRAQSKFLKIEQTDKYLSFILMIEGMIGYVIGDKDAIGKLENAYNLDFENKWVRLELFYTSLNTEEDYKAWGYLEEAITIDENYYEALYQRISYYDTIENCRQIILEILEFPQTYINSEILNTLAFAYYNCFEIDNAKKILKGSLEIEETGRAYYLHGLIQQEEGNLENAIDYFNKSYLMEPATDILSSKAWVLYDMNEIEASEETLLLMFNSEPTQDHLNQILDFYLKTKNLKNFNFYLNQPVKDGHGFMRDGYMILRDYVFRLADIKSLAHDYSLKYSENEILWFKQTFNEYAKE